MGTSRVGPFTDRPTEQIGTQSGDKRREIAELQQLRYCRDNLRQTPLRFLCTIDRRATDDRRL